MDSLSLNIFQKLVLAGALGMAIAFSGCTAPTVSEQRLLAKPLMTFSNELTYGYQSQLQAQIIPGLATSGGSQAAGCTSCK
ncbi:MAG: hypothetical protein SFY80_04260 [Verrucomicrobiota bacterium]|nr:hypothetical protein [Verrucomicrobiota bacterium]